jgi:hypothetical protein
VNRDSRPINPDQLLIIYCTGPWQRRPQRTDELKNEVRLADCSSARQDVESSQGLGARHLDVTYTVYRSHAT